MLRSTRPLLASSSRAITAQKHAISSLRSLPSKSSTAPRITSPIASKIALPRASSLIQRTGYATKSPSGLQAGIDPEEEKKVAQRKLKADPETVSTESSVRHMYEPQTEATEKPVGEGVKEDLESVKDTFALNTVPKESYWLGLAGTVPYLATSLSTVYLSWDLNTVWPSQSSFVNNILIQHDTARQLLSTLEPLQLGYGAIIISFLGAIHWGLEYAERKPLLERTRFRYGMGVGASVLAWPTLLMPMEFALTSQFAAFVALYFADVKATNRGWAPSWYGTYRFVLTAVVGAAIVISLIGRAKVGSAAPRLSGLDQKLHGDAGFQEYDEHWAKREAQDKARMKKEEEEKKKREEEEKKKKEEEEKKAKKEEEKKTKGGEGKKEDEKKEGDKN